MVSSAAAARVATFPFALVSVLTPCPCCGSFKLLQYLAPAPFSIGLLVRAGVWAASKYPHALDRCHSLLSPARRGCRLAPWARWGRICSRFWWFLLCKCMLRRWCAIRLCSCFFPCTHESQQILNWPHLRCVLAACFGMCSWVSCMMPVLTPMPPRCPTAFNLAFGTQLEEYRDFVRTAVTLFRSACCHNMPRAVFSCSLPR